MKKQQKQRSTQKAAPSRDRPPEALSAKQTMQFGQPAPAGINWRNIPKRTLVILAIVVLGLAGWVFNSIASSLKEKTLENNGYTYHLLFYGNAGVVESEAGYNVLKHSSMAVATVRPTSDSILRDCHQVGEAWEEKFLVTIEGQERPVCSSNNLTFYTNYEKFGSRHIVSITYREVQNTNKYPAIQKVLQSVRAEE